MVQGQVVLPDERSSESCLRCEINDLIQKHVEGQEKIDIADLAANLEEAGTWYYVVDCATCKAVVPFKYAPEGEPIVCFPTMNVRCFQCHTDHTYAADLISHRKAAAPCGISKRDRPPSHASNGDREASRDRQGDLGAGDSGGRVIIERNIDPISASSQWKNILNVVVSEGEQRYSSCRRASLPLDGFRTSHWTSSTQPYLNCVPLVRQCYWGSRSSVQYCFASHSLYTGVAATLLRHSALNVG